MNTMNTINTDTQKHQARFHYVAMPPQDNLKNGLIIRLKRYKKSDNVLCEITDLKSKSSQNQTQRQEQQQNSTAEQQQNSTYIPIIASVDETEYDDNNTNPTGILCIHVNY